MLLGESGRGVDRTQLQGVQDLDGSLHTSDDNKQRTACCPAAPVWPTSHSSRAMPYVSYGNFRPGTWQPACSCSRPLQRITALGRGDLWFGQRAVRSTGAYGLDAGYVHIIALQLLVVFVGDILGMQFG